MRRVVQRTRSVAIGAALLLAGGALFNFAALAKHHPKRHTVARHLTALYKQGQKTFRFDTFGDEAYWGGQLQLHKAIEGAANGGVGGGVTRR
jgi:hypothetical protein